LTGWIDDYYSLIDDQLRMQNYPPIKLNMEIKSELLGSLIKKPQN